LGKSFWYPTGRKVVSFGKPSGTSS
jgi:hypothetical protein